MDILRNYSQKFEIPECLNSLLKLITIKKDSFLINDFGKLKPPWLENDFLFASEFKLDDKAAFKGFGQSEKKEIALIKAISEVIERYNFYLIKKNSIPKFFLTEAEARRIAEDRKWGFYSVLDCFSGLKGFRNSREFDKINRTISYELSDNKIYLIPHSFILGGHVPGFRGYYQQTGNGLASHTLIEKAILNGIFEWIERDAVLNFWHGMKIPLLIEDCNLEVFLNTKEFVREYGFECKLFLLESVSGIPVIMCSIFSSNLQYPIFSPGFGCGFNLEEAVSKAVKECSRCFWFYYNEDCCHGKRIHCAPRTKDVKNIEDHISLFFYNTFELRLLFMLLGNARTVEYDRIENLSNFSKKPSTLHDLLNSPGMINNKIFVINCMNEDWSFLKLYTVYVVVAGLQNLYFGFHPELVNKNRINLSGFNKINYLPHFIG